MSDCLHHSYIEHPLLVIYGRVFKQNQLISLTVTKFNVISYAHITFTSLL